MSLATLLAIALGLCITAYAVFAGADFGAGILELTFGEDQTGRRARRAIAAAIGPLWEANHVWLILSSTILFSAFPAAFAAAGTQLLAPLTIALLALVARGAALGARSSAEAGSVAHRRLTLIFGAASIATPLAFGAAVGGIAQISTAGAAAAAQRPAVAVPWDNGFSVAVGLLAVTLCAHLGACFVAARLDRVGERELADRIAARAVLTGSTVLAMGVITLAVAALDAPVLAARLEGPAAPVLIIGIVLAAVSPAAVLGGRLAQARLAAVLSAVTLIWGWLATQAPHLIGQRLTIGNAAASPAALTAVAVAFVLVAVAVIPALFLLFGVFGRPAPETTS